MIAKTAIAILFFALAQENGFTHIGQAFQASSPIKLSKGCSSERPYFFVLKAKRERAEGATTVRC